MGDTEYMAKKAFDGKAIRVTADIDSIGSKLSYTVTGSKRFYFHSAKIVITGHTTPAVSPLGGLPATNIVKNAVEADLLINSVVVDTTNIGMATAVSAGAGGAFAGGSGYGNVGDGKFDVKGRTAESGEIIEIENIVDDGTATATLIGFEEDTGTDPTILAQSITVDANVTGEATDIGFVQDRVLTGNYFQESGDINAINDTIEFVVPNGKTAFLLEAKIVPGSHISTPTSFSSSANKVNAALNIDGVKKDETSYQLAWGAISSGSGIGGAGYGMNAGKFVVKGLSLVGDGIKVIEIENIIDDGSAFATMSGYLIDT